MYYYKIDNLPIASTIELNDTNGYPNAITITEQEYNEMLNPAPIEPTEFEIAKANKQDALNAYAYTFVYNGFQDTATSYKLFTAEDDIKNYALVASSIQMLPDDFSVEFGTYQGWVTDTAINVKGLLSRYTEYVYPNTAKIMRIKGEIERATTVEEIEAIVI